MSKAEIDIDRGHLVVIYIQGCLDELRMLGMVEGDSHLSESGRQVFAALKSRRFRISNEEKRNCLHSVTGATGDDLDMFVTLVDDLESGDMIKNLEAHPLPDIEEQTHIRDDESGCS